MFLYDLHKKPEYHIDNTVIIIWYTKIYSLEQTYPTFPIILSIMINSKKTLKQYP